MKTMSNAAAICALMNETNCRNLTVRGFKAIKRSAESLCANGVLHAGDLAAIYEAAQYNFEYWNEKTKR